MRQDMRGQLCTCRRLALWRGWRKWHMRVLSAEQDGDCYMAESALHDAAGAVHMLLCVCISSGSCAQPCPALEG